MLAQNDQYRTTVTNRDKQTSRNTAAKHRILINNKYNQNYQTLLTYNRIMCKTTQWILSGCITILLFSMTYYVSISGYKNISELEHFHLPTCTTLYNKISALQEQNSFLNLLHTQFIPSVSISIKALKNQIDTINLDGDEWASSGHQRVTKLAIIKDKRYEFESLLKQIWDKLHRKGLFAYNVHDLPTKIVSDGNSKFTANAYNPYDIQFELLFNQHRIQKLQRKNSVKAGKNINVKEEWNENSFNFYQVPGDNLMAVIDDTFLDLDDVDDISNDIFACYDSQSLRRINWEQKHLVLLNKFPIGKYSGLLIPFIGSHSAQLLTKEALETGIRFANMFDSDDFRIGYNSMGAMASVNQLHFQFWEIKSISRARKLPIEILSEILEKRKVGLIYSDDDLIIRELIGYPIHGFIYERNLNRHKKYNSRIHGISRENIGFDVDIFLQPLYHCIEYLIENNIPHNLLMNRQKIFVFVRREETASKYPIFYGFADVSGWITLLDEYFYDTLTLNQLWHDMENQISIDDNKWEIVKNYCKSV